MERDDFADRLRSKEVGRTDQAEALETERRREAEVSRLILANARRVFDGMEPLAESLVATANSTVESKYQLTKAAGGFVLEMGRETAGFSYSQMFANQGPISLVVRIQQRPSNLEAFGLAEPSVRSSIETTWRFVPVWNADSNDVHWRGPGGTLSGESLLLRRVMEILMDRAD